MHLSSYFSSLVAVFISVCILHFGRSAVYAQTNKLKLCTEPIQKARESASATKSLNQPSFVTIFDPAYQKAQQSHQAWASCVKGQKAPLSAFKTLNGESFDTTALAGKILVVNFWFMSCAPCRGEFPAFNRLVEEYKGQNVLFLGFTPDRVANLKPSFFEQNRFDFKIIPEAQSLANSFSIMGYPTTYIVDQRGVISQAWIGFAGNGTDTLAPYHTAKAAIDNLLTAADK